MSKNVPASILLLCHCSICHKRLVINSLFYWQPVQFLQVQDRRNTKVLGMNLGTGVRTSKCSCNIEPVEENRILTHKFVKKNVTIVVNAAWHS